jgi:hypothetical protein
MSSFINSKGEVQQLTLDVTMYREAAKKGMSLPHYLAATYDTNVEKYGSVFNQLMASEGIFVTGNRELGIRPSTMAEILDRPSMDASQIVKDAIPASRILFPAVFMQAIEDKLIANLTMTPDAFDSLVGYEESINGERYEQPLINFDKPSAARAMGVSQLSQPASMLTITTSDKAYRIPNWALGLEVSDQALKATTIDFVALSLARQAAIERAERAQNYLLALWNGDVDNNDGSLSSLGLVDASNTFDAAATGGVFTQKAWMKFLMKNGTKRTITHIITDIDTAMKIETRTGKPTITQDDSKTSRFDTQFNVMNPTWAKNPQLFIADTAYWTAGNVMAIDKSWAIRRVKNLTAEYQGIENYVMRRSTAMRFDFGEHVNRLYNDAFAGLTMS